LEVTVFLPIIFFILVGVVIAVAAAISALKNQKSPQKPIARYHSRRYKYMPGEFSEQMELDLRLPHRRFRQLYPTSRLTYEEYKRLQMQRAFRRSMRSQDNPRMVR
jgi:hypothetical protein